MKDNKKSFSESFGSCMGSLIVTVVFFLVESWAVMLLIGGIHHEWLYMMPTISYSASMNIVILIYVVTFTGKHLLSSSK